MSKPISKLWALGPFVALALLFVAYYMKRPEFREVVDARLPWVRETMARFGALASEGENTEAFGESEPGMPNLSAGVVEDLAGPHARIPPREPRQTPIDIGNLHQFPAAWPKTVTLKTPVDFPAVVKGKVVGSLRAPPGSEANLVEIRDGKVGLEYRGGGAWLKMEETDVIERVRGAPRDQQEVARP